MLEQELRYFESHRAELLKKDADRYALVVGDRCVSVYDTASLAYEAGLEAVGNVPMLIKQITPTDPLEQVPALALVLADARSYA